MGHTPDQQELDVDANAHWKTLADTVGEDESGVEGAAVESTHLSQSLRAQLHAVAQLRAAVVARDVSALERLVANEPAFTHVAKVRAALKVFTV